MVEVCELIYNGKGIKRLPPSCEIASDDGVETRDRKRRRGDRGQVTFRHVRSRVGDILLPACNALNLNPTGLTDVFISRVSSRWQQSTCLPVRLQDSSASRYVY